MQTADPTIRIQQLNGTWTTIGVDNVRGLYADGDSLTLSANGYGSDQASFTLKRDPRVFWPDLFAFSPVEIDVAGERVWSGRIKETPTSDGSERQINVSCEGDQYELDDDTMTRNYINLDMSGWQDARSFLTTDLSFFNSAGTVDTPETGVLKIGYDSGNTWPANGIVGVVLDQGPDPEKWARRISFDYKKDTGGIAQVLFFVRLAEDPANLTAGVAYQDYEDIVGSQAVTLIGTTYTTLSFTLRGRGGSSNGLYRYISLFLFNSAGAYTATTEDHILLTNIKLYGDTAYKQSFTATRGIANTLDKGTKFSSGADKTYYDTVMNDNPSVFARLSTPVAGNLAGAGRQSDDGTNTNINFNVVTGAPSRVSGLLSADPDEAAQFGGGSAISSGTPTSFTALNQMSFFSLECWYKPTASGGNYDMVNQSNGSTVNQFEMRNIGGLLRGGFNDSGGTLYEAIGGSFVTNNIHHCVCTYDGTAIRVYLNGVQTGFTPATAAPGTGAGPIVIGGFNNGVGITSTMVGVLDEVAIYPYALSATQVAEHYSVGHNGQAYGSLLETTSFEIPEYAPTDPKRPRENIDALNAYHGWQFKINENRQPVYRALPDAPIVETGAWAGADFQDASANSGTDVFSHAHVTAQAADNSELSLKVGQSPTTFEVVKGLVTNPSADTNVTGWRVMASGLTLARVSTLGYYVTPPASFEIFGPTSTNPFGGMQLDVSAPGLLSGFTFKQGKTYRLTATMMASGSSTPYTTQPGMFFGSSVSAFPTTVTGNGGAPGVFNTYTLDWTPTKDWDSSLINATIFFQTPTTLGTAQHITVYIDDVYIFESVDPTLAGRWNFQRTTLLPISAKMTTAACIQIADTYLDLHRTSPFKGSLTAQAGGLRDARSGDSVHPSRALTMTQELIRFSHIIDPDTGGLGRHGRIATVTYTHSNQQASIDIDSTRKGFEALLSRVGILQAARANLR